MPIPEPERALAENYVVGHLVCFKILVVSGAIHAGLALRSGSTLMRFPLVLKEEITSRQQLLNGVASAGSSRYRHACIAMFMQRGANVEQRCRGVGPQGTDEVTEYVVAGLVTALTAAAPLVYGRHSGPERM